MPAFRWLFAGQTVSAVGDQVLPVAVAAVVVGRGGSAGELGLVLAARTAALVLFALLGGVWADRLPRVRVLVAADVVRLLATAGLAVAVGTGSPPTWALAALVLVVGAGEAFSRPAYSALLPTVLPAEQLPAGNALSGGGRHLAQVLGPGLAGALLLVTGPAAVFAVDAASFGISLLTLLRVAEPVRRRAPRRRLHAEVAEGLVAVRERPWVGAVLAMSCAQLLLALAPATVLLPIVLDEGGARASAYGLVLAAGALGGLAGVLVAGWWRPAHPGLAGLLCLAAWALPPLGLLVQAPVPLLAAAWALGGAGLGPFNVWWETALQRAVPPHLLARVVSLDWLCSLALLPLGLALVGPVVALVGRGPVLAAAVGAMAVTSLLPLLVPGVRDLRDPAGRGA
ncbi:MFS transporter [Vallicoccus soli]|uniref:MFS transporter n=1 Tax=Vallicoccus soli TaxID=2339232 RepID=UPI001402BE51|nr:MFS transporter [Vallicoccus soli]